jgi:2',3'-cyclic-nucleotide 2'-phosphodiesterase/3'-nucleotidase/5'-nucleotidase
VRAGNEYGFGPPSPTVKVTTPALEVDKATPYANQWGVSVDQDIKVIFNQPIKLLDADKVQVYEKVTGKPLPKEITIDQQQMTIVVALAAATDYQVVFYEQALEGTEYTEIYNTIMGWDFTTKQQSSGGSKSRSKGGSKVEIPKTEVPTPTEPIKEENPTKVTFNDIQAHWAQKDIEALAAKGIIKGITAEYYAPEESINRAQFATLLVRCLDLKEKTPPSPFNDVKQDDWHYDSVTKAHAHGIVRGVTTDNFDPAGQITREQMAVMMANALKYQDINITVDSSILNKFTDQQQISPWAVEACAMVVQYEIMQGANDIFMPSEITTRAQSAAVLNRFIELMTDQRGAN